MGPFMASSAPDLEHLEVESAKLDEKLKGTAEVSPDSESGDSTAEQENRGFVHILDVIQKEELKKRHSKARTKEVLYAKKGEQKRAVLKYSSLEDTDNVLDSKGAQINKAA
ncbi:MAG: hypothetical protein HRT45_06790 [Bdellovibrionales bacterium]|nr:hypothetical protein [Bdellovibrionales bacterium]